MDLSSTKGQTKTAQVSSDPHEWTELKLKNTVEKEGSENNKTEKRDVHDHYSQRELLGYGAYGYVYAGDRKSDGKKVALKFMDKNKYFQCLTIPGDTRSLPVEVALLELVCRPPHCPFVIELLEWFETPNTIILVLERPIPCVDLSAFSASNNMNEAEIRIIMHQVVFAAYHCLERGVFHRDIKERNILVNPKTLEVKLIDFGCGDLHKDTKYTKKIGTKMYQPPEFYLENKYEAEPFTVWSLGVLLYILLCGRVPFFNKNEIAVCYLYIPKTLSKDSKELLLWCLQKDPKRRPTLIQILSHDWFRRKGKSKRMPESLNRLYAQFKEQNDKADAWTAEAQRHAEQNNIRGRKHPRFVVRVFDVLSTIFSVRSR